MIETSKKIFDFEKGILRLDFHSSLDACMSILAKIDSLQGLELVVLSSCATKYMPQGFYSELAKKLEKKTVPLLKENSVLYTTVKHFQRVNSCELDASQRARLHLFCAERATLQLPQCTFNDAEIILDTVAVIGAGTMGSGIAMCFANAGIKVILLDAEEEGLRRGLNSIQKNYDRAVERGRLSEAQGAAAVNKIHGDLKLQAIEGADLVIEAVYEDMELKKSLFKDLDKYAKQGAILATNTSTFDINEIAEVTNRPESVVGLHFFSPANIMPLLEVVRTESSSDDSIVQAMTIAKIIKKTPVLANICYGFIGNRMMEVYAREAEAMLLEGASPGLVDQALEDFGMAMGILRVFDMAGVDVGVKAHQANAALFPPDPTYYQASQALYDAGRLGQKTGAGFYSYQAGDRRAYDDDVAVELIQARALKLGIEQRNNHTAEEVQERCLYPLMNEALNILDEGVAAKASDIDVVWTLGYGFPRSRGGPLYYAEQAGLAKLLEGILKYQNRFGDLHWKVSPLLSKLVERGQSINEWQQENRRLN